MLTLHSKLVWARYGVKLVAGLSTEWGPGLVMMALFKDGMPPLAWSWYVFCGPYLTMRHVAWLWFSSEVPKLFSF